MTACPRLTLIRFKAAKAGNMDTLALTDRLDDRGQNGLHSYLCLIEIHTCPFSNFLDHSPLVKSSVHGYYPLTDQISL